MRRSLVSTIPGAAATVWALAASPALADVGQPTPVRPPGTEGLSTLLNWGMSHPTST